MKFSDLIDPSRIVLGARAADKAQALAEIARRAGARLPIAQETILNALDARERLGSTGFGRGFALPHLRLAEVTAPFGLLLRLARPIPFDAIDAVPVDILFALLLPQADGAESIAPLAVVSRCMRDEGNLRAIRKAGGPGCLFDFLQRAYDRR